MQWRMQGRSVKRQFSFYFNKKIDFSKYQSYSEEANVLYIFVFKQHFLQKWGQNANKKIPKKLNTHSMDI